MRKYNFRKSKDLIVALSFFLSSCVEDKSFDVPEVYVGYLSESKGVRAVYTDSGVVNMIFGAPHQIEKPNGDQEFPKGIHVEFMHNDSVKKSDIKSDYAIYVKEKDQWVLKNDVIVNNLDKSQILTTEELFWIKKKKMISSKDTVKISTPDYDLKGIGFEADEAFENYTLDRPDGLIYKQLE